MKRLFTILGLISLLLSSSAVSAEERVYSPEELDRFKSSLVNKRITVEAKYRYAVSSSPPYINLLNYRGKFYFILSTGKGRNYSRDKDDAGTRLTPKKANVRLTGRFLQNSGQYKQLPRGVVFIMDSLKALPDDLPLFQGKMDASLKGQPKNFEALRKIARDARAWSKRYSVGALDDFAKSCYRKSLEIQSTQIKENDVAKQINVAKDYVALAGDKAEAISRLNKLYHQSIAEGEKVVVTKMLRGWGAYYYRNKWVDYANLKVQLGFRRRGGKWVTKERAEFLDEIDGNKDKRNTFLAPSTDLLSRANSGEAAKGQSRNMIVNMASGSGRMGFPKYVDRVVIETKKDKRTYVQWIYPGKHRFYFVNGQLFSWHRGSPPYPEK